MGIPVLLPDMTRKALWLIVLSLLVTFTITPAIIRGDVDPSFDESVHVQLNASGIGVTWVSAEQEDGHVEWALNAAKLASNPNVATDARGSLAERVNKRTHRVVVGDVPGGSTIYYQLVSGGVTTGPYSVTIPTTPLTAPPDLLRGVVMYPDVSLGIDCIVSMRVRKEFEFMGSQFIEYSLWTNTGTDGGTYSMDITNIRQDPTNLLNNNYNQQFSYNKSAATSEITVIAQCDPDNVGQTTETTAEAGFTGSGYEDFDVQLAPPTPTFYITDVSVDESAGSAILTISLSPAASGSVAVSYDTADGTAAAPADYTASDGTELFTAGSTSKTIAIPIIDDALDEPDETFSVTLSDPIGGTVISRTAERAAVTILDDEPPVAVEDSYIVREDQTLTVDPPGVLTNDTTPPGVTLTAIKVSDPANGALTLDSDGGFTYVPVSAGEETVTITVTFGNRPPAANDDLYGAIPGQSLTVGAPGVLANDTDPDDDPLTAVLVSEVPTAEGAVALGANGFFIYDPGSFVGTTSFAYQAKDPDQALSNVATVTLVVGVPELSIADVTLAEGAGAVTLNVTSNTAPVVDVTVDYATADLTATGGADYTVTLGTATILAGQTSTTITVPILDDTEAEPEETFTVTLSNPSGEALILDGTATVTIDDAAAPVPTPVPGLTSWGLLSLAGLIAGALLWKRRRRSWGWFSLMEGRMRTPQRRASS